MPEVRPPRCSPAWPSSSRARPSGPRWPRAAGKSGARLERVVIGGQPYVLKHLDLAEDWTMRASGCLRGAPLLAWERGLLARLPACFNQPIVGVAPEDGDGPAAVGRLCRC